MKSQLKSQLKAGALFAMLACLSACGAQIVEFADDAGTVVTPPVAPTVVSTLPVNGGTGVGTGSSISATFSKAMDPATITQATFTVQQGSTPVSGDVTIDSVTNTATFTASAALAGGKLYTATIS